MPCRTNRVYYNPCRPRVYEQCVPDYRCYTQTRAVETMAKGYGELEAKVIWLEERVNSLEKRVNKLDNKPKNTP